MTKTVRMLSNGTERLEDALKVKMNARSMRRIGCNYESTVRDKTVPAEYDPTMLAPKSQHYARHWKPYHKSRNGHWRCDFCGSVGHIKPFCYKLYGYPLQKKHSMDKHGLSNSRKGRKSKVNIYCLMAHTSP